jgi:DNA-directed RNA polymerase subunit RPC12/RpoP
MGQVVAKAKVCCRCGTDLTGKKRLRDSLGYWCVECHRADQAANAPKGVRCADCGRIVPETALTDYDGIRICGKCLGDRKEIGRRERKFGKVDDRVYKEADRKRVIMFAVIFAILLLIIILQKLHVLKSLF